MPTETPALEARLKELQPLIEQLPGRRKKFEVAQKDLESYLIESAKLVDERRAGELKRNETFTNASALFEEAQMAHDEALLIKSDTGDGAKVNLDDYTLRYYGTVITVNDPDAPQLYVDATLFNFQNELRLEKRNKAYAEAKRLHGEAMDKYFAQPAGKRSVKEPELVLQGWKEIKNLNL